jgi:hypothetical protein
MQNSDQRAATHCSPQTVILSRRHLHYSAGFGFRFSLFLTFAGVQRLSAERGRLPCRRRRSLKDRFDSRGMREFIEFLRRDVKMGFAEGFRYES